MRKRALWSLHAVGLVLLLGACGDDADPDDPRDDCLRKERGLVLGDHVHGTPTICSGLQYLYAGEVEFITIPEGQTTHTHSTMVTGQDARRLFGGGSFSAQTVATGSSHQHLVTFNP